MQRENTWRRRRCADILAGARDRRRGGAIQAVVEQLEARLFLAANAIVEESELPSSPRSEVHIRGARALITDGFATGAPAAATGGYFTLTQPDGSTATGWMYNKRISIQNTGVTLNNYQVKITLDNTFPFGHARSDGSDVRIVDANGQVIPYWIQSWDPTGQSATIWVRLATFAGGATTTLSIYYGNPQAVAFEVPPKGPFVKLPNNPILTTTPALPENIVQDPSTGQYWIPFTAGGSQIGLAWADSPDGPWTDYGRVLSTEVSDSASPHLMVYNGTWYLYYADSNWDIKLATASAVTGPYTVYGSTPMVSRGPAGSWDGSRVLEQYVLYDGTQWRMLYMGDAGLVTEQVGQATAPSPVGPWTKDTANPVIAFGPAQSFDAGTVADPFAYKFGDTWYIFYAASETKEQPWENAVATTKDFVTFTKGNIVLNRGSTGEFDDHNTHRGGLIRVGDYYYMSYTGVKEADLLWHAGMARQYAKSTASGYPAEQVFGAYSDFDGASLPDTWYQGGGTGGSNTVTNGSLTIHSGSGTYNQIQSGAQFGVGSMIEVRFRAPQADGTGHHSAQIGLGSLSGGDGLVRILDYGTGTWQIWSTDGGSHETVVDTGVPITTDWVTVRLAWAAPGVIKYQINNTPWQKLNANVPVTGSDLHAYLMASADPGYTTNMDVDWVMVRTYAETDPLIALSTEFASGNRGQLMKASRSR